VEWPLQQVAAEMVGQVEWEEGQVEWEEVLVVL
jgi:hypothetical protein